MNYCAKSNAPGGMFSVAGVPDQSQEEYEASWGYDTQPRLVSGRLGTWSCTDCQTSHWGLSPSTCHIRWTCWGTAQHQAQRFGRFSPIKEVMMVGLGMQDRRVTLLHRTMQQVMRLENLMPSAGLHAYVPTYHIFLPWWFRSTMYFSWVIVMKNTSSSLLSLPLLLSTSQRKI